MISQLRTGVGIDAHQFGDAGPCLLAGLEWPGARRLVGHSDGDAAIHAICDALLSATQMGDVGTVFGTDKPEWAGASGVKMLAYVNELLTAKNFSINNVSVVIVGNEPRIGVRRLEAQELLSQILSAPVSISATTTDGMGFTGRGEGVSVTATALVVAP